MMKKKSPPEIAQQNISDLRKDLLILIEEPDLTVFFREMDGIKAALLSILNNSSKSDEGRFKEALVNYWGYCEGFAVEPLRIDVKYWTDFGLQAKQLLKSFLLEDSLQNFETDSHFLDLKEKFYKLREKLEKDGVIKPHYY